MSVSILEVIESAGYNLQELEDAEWLLAQQNQFEELVEAAEELVMQHDEDELEESERKYQERFGDDK